MSSSFSANQYESAFRSQRLQNWCVTKPFKEVSCLSLHLLLSFKVKGGAWPDYKGTWDLPARIAPPHINTTARSAAGLDRLRTWGLCPPQRGQSLSPSSSRNTDRGHQVRIQRASTSEAGETTHEAESKTSSRPESGSQSNMSEQRAKSSSRSTERQPAGPLRSGTPCRT
uniref:Protein Flattop n=1 Tax=Cyprinodon variegatus TaxID=28743 RepID=A0A3Q2E461_CYPVA